MSIIRQVLCTFIGCFVCMNIGFIYAWPSSTIQMFASTNTTLNRPMTKTEEALFGSIFAITAVVSTPISGWLLDVIGRKNSCLLFALPQAIAWAMISVSSTVEMVLTSIAVSGLGGCLFTIVPLFISEISQENIRGTLVGGVNVFYGIGVVTSYIFGGYLDYRTMNYTCLAIAVAGLAMLMYIKETPLYLLRKGLDEEARKSVAFYRSTTVDSKEVLEEIEVIRRSMSPSSTNYKPVVTSEEKCLEPMELELAPQKISLIQFIKNSKSSQRAIYVVLVITFLSLFQGLAAVQVYAQPLFEEAMPNVSGNLLSIFFGLLNTAVGFTGAYLVDIYGRRALMIYASIGSCLSCLALASQVQFQWGPLWLNAVFLFMFCIAYTFGAGTVPYILMAELFLPEVKSFMMMLAQEWAWICNFLIVFILSVVVSTFGLAAVFTLFAVSGFLAVVFCYYCLPETTALPVDVIQTLLLEKRRQVKA